MFGVGKIPLTRSMMVFCLAG